ncbi:MAG: hypothetical protein ACD_19C00014G0047 [uncultured bacterium]|nr:MAG: hypothetical protein ACD_19C00014G0047 [uncultured bacterium]
MFNFKNKKIIVFITIASILILFIVFALVNKKNVLPSVINTIPQDKSEEILETSQIEIFFKDDLTEEDKSNIHVILNPSFELDSTWNLNVFKIIPKNNLENPQNYNVTINYKDKSIYSFSFKTSIFSQDYIQKNKFQATEDDLLYGEALKAVIDKHPWYPNLPIKTQNYVVYYDFEKEKFTITFLKPITDQKTIDDFIKDAIIKIKEIGGNDPVQYYINK